MPQYLVQVELEEEICEHEYSKEEFEVEAESADEAEAVAIDRAIADRHWTVGISYTKVEELHA